MASEDPKLLCILKELLAGPVVVGGHGVFGVKQRGNGATGHEHRNHNCNNHSGVPDNGTSVALSLLCHHDGLDHAGKYKLKAELCCCCLAIATVQEY